MISMLQHEFSIQIKGRTDCTIEEYYQIPRISNALPVETQKDKEFVFSIFLEYQNMLRISSVYETSSLSRSIKTDDPIILSDPYNVNGLEFKCVILFGVDEGRLPQNTGVSDISANYIKYIAFNQLYLASSRAKYRLILIGNSLHGVSSCLQYALESGKLETGDQV